jgi:hypothetical protein
MVLSSDWGLQRLTPKEASAKTIRTSEESELGR